MENKTVGGPPCGWHHGQIYLKRSHNKPWPVLDRQRNQPRLLIPWVAMEKRSTLVLHSGSFYFLSQERLIMFSCVVAHSETLNESRSRKEPRTRPCLRKVGTGQAPYQTMLAHGRYGTGPRRRSRIERERVGGRTLRNQATPPASFGCGIPFHLARGELQVRAVLSTLCTYRNLHSACRTIHALIHERVGVQVN